MKQFSKRYQRHIEVREHVTSNSKEIAFSVLIIIDGVRKITINLSEPRFGISVIQTSGIMAECRGLLFTSGL